MCVARDEEIMGLAEREIRNSTGGRLSRSKKYNVHENKYNLIQHSYYGIVQMDRNQQATYSVVCHLKQAGRPYIALQTQKCL